MVAAQGQAVVINFPTGRANAYAEGRERNGPSVKGIILFACAPQDKIDIPRVRRNAGHGDGVHRIAQGSLFQARFGIEADAETAILFVNPRRHSVLERDDNRGVADAEGDIGEFAVDGNVEVRARRRGSEGEKHGDDDTGEEAGCNFHDNLPENV